MIPVTKDQTKAICHGKGSACVIAGAGTGKTRTLINRIVYLTETKHIEPSRILVTTFTRKATAELYHKVYQELREPAHRLRISTIDALIWDFAQQAMHRGFMDSMRLIGEAHQRILLFEAAWQTFGWQGPSLRDLWTENAGKAGVVGLMEGCVRVALATGLEKETIKHDIHSRLEKLKGRFDLHFDFEIPSYQALERAAKEYFEKLKYFGVIDHANLSRKFCECLKQHKQLVEQFASEVEEILVDEFQDTSRVQADILILLAGRKRNIWVVGDQCQQIYEWRGAGPENLRWFIKKTHAKEYYLTGNWRSTQPILDSAYRFLCRRVPGLKRNRMLRPLQSERGNQNDELVYTGTLDRALWLIKRRLVSSPALRPSDIAVLSRKLDKATVKQIRQMVKQNRLEVQVHSSRADHALEQTIGSPPRWKPGKALDSLYSHPAVQKRISGALRKRDFSDLRILRPLATAAEALDSTSREFTFSEAWPALKITQDRDVFVTPAVVSQKEAIQVMTIHAAKGLEFPVVLLMKLGKGSQKSFPNPKDPEDSRLAYVGATRARDLLVLVHTQQKPTKTLSAFGKNLVAIRRGKRESVDTVIHAPAVLETPPLIAATHLDYYEQCPLKFAAYHEGRFLPKWSLPQSMGSRLHKAIEYYLRAEMPKKKAIIDQCFVTGVQDGDSRLRMLSTKLTRRMATAYQEAVTHISKSSAKVIAVEKRYRYMQPNSGQVEGVIDGILERRDGVVALKEWKTSDQVMPERRQQYELQARVGALAILRQNTYPVHVIEIVPILRPQKTVSIPIDNAFEDETVPMLEEVFKALKDRSYEHRSGKHCDWCGLKPQCPAWPKS